MPQLRWIALLLLTARCACSAALPEQTSTAQQPTPPDLFGRMGGFLAPAPGVQVQLVETNEVFSNLAGGYRRGTIFEGLVQPSLQLDLDKLWHWTGASFQASGLYAYGDSLTQRFVRDLNVVSNIDAYDSPRLVELWFQQEIGNFSARAGILQSDSEFLISESAALFLNSAFGAPPSFSDNVAAPTFPLAAPGLRLAWDSKGIWSARLGVFSGDIGQQAVENRHGTRFAFSSRDGALVLGEVVCKLPWKPAGQPLPGTLKLGGLYDSGALPDTLNTGETKRGLGGAYLIFDQALYREPQAKSKDAEASDQGLNGFFRTAYSGPEDHAVVPYYFEAGLTYKGLWPGRNDDTCGLAVSHSALRAEIPDATAHHETVLEATYQAAFSKHLTVQPDAQFVFDPGGTQRVATAVVLGLRCTLTF